MKIAVVILAAGSGKRANLGCNKLLRAANGRTVIEATADRFDAFDKVIVAARDDLARMRGLFGARKDTSVVEGGATRCSSSRAGVEYCAALGYDAVLIHDGARPYLSARDLGACIADLETFGNSIMTLPCTDSVRYRGASVDREEVLRMATPQAFLIADLAKAFAKAKRDDYTDDASLYEYYAGKPLRFTLCQDRNDKITTADDFAAFAGGISRFGIGYDEHRMVERRPLILCGVRFETPYGLLGHSDADAPIHALMDAVLSAAGLKDIGTYFPDTDPAFESADSMKLLDRVVELAAKEGFRVHNVSLVIHAQRPKLAPRIDEMRACLAARLGLNVDAIGISATSGEGMGHIGRGEGLAAQAVVSMKVVF